MFGRHTFKCILFIFAIGCGSVFGSEPISFSLKRGVPEIQVTINDSIRASFIIDTGADQVYIDKTFADRHGLLSGGKLAMRGVTGITEKVEAYQVFLRSLSIGEIKQNVVNTVVIDLPVIIKDTSRGLPDGVLGFSFLRGHKVNLNYRDATLTLLDVADSVSEKFNFVQIPFVLNRHLIVVNATINDSFDVKLILDTGASYSLLSPQLFQRLKINDTTMVQKIKLDSKLIASNVRILVRDISKVVNLQQDNEISGILGTTFLQGRQLTIDYKNNELLFYPAR